MIHRPFGCPFFRPNPSPEIAPAGPENPVFTRFPKRRSGPWDTAKATSVSQPEICR